MPRRTLNGVLRIGRALLLVSHAMLLVLVASCAAEPVSYEQQVLSWRAEKDREFRTATDSPIPEAERATFTGLSYFEIDRKYQVPAALVELETSSMVIEMDTTDGRRERMRVIGRLDFTIEGERRSLTAFLPESAPNRERLFVPFRDATNRTETYGGGRYLDLPRASTGLYDLDFNRAYNPFCVYDAEYVCPLPPRENTLTIPIRAGEKMPAGKRAS